MHNPAPPHTTTPPDSHIDPSAALTYWTAIPATVNGMLGGYPQISRTDLASSARFLAKLRRTTATAPSTPLPLLPRVADCGAGIGRITTGFLLHVAAVVDVVEPVAKFTDALVAAEAEVQAARTASSTSAAKPRGTLGAIHNLPLEDWHPAPRAYNLIWNQWCLGQLRDGALAAYLGRCGEALVAPGGADGGGWVVVKENLSTHPGGEDVYDPEDSSVTRTDAKWRALFARAGLRVVAEETQRGLPGELFPVRCWALRPVEWG